MQRTEPLDSNLDVLRFLWSVLDTRRRWQLAGLQWLAVIMGITTLGGVAAVIPFFALLGDPTLIDHGRLAQINHALAFESRESFLVFLGVGFVAMVLLSNLVNFLGVLAINRFAYGVGADLHATLFDEYLYRDYLFHVRTHSAILVNNIVHEVGRVATGIVQSALLLTSSLVGCALIGGSLLLFSPAIALGAAVLLGGSYLLFYAAVRGRLARNGARELQIAQQRARTLTESFGAIRELQVFGRQRLFSERFAAQCREFARVLVNTQVLALAPRHMAESTVAAGLVGAALWLSVNSPSGHWLPSLSFLGLAAYRLLPSLQQAFAALAKLRLDRIAFRRIAADLDRERKLGAPRIERPIDARWQGRPHHAIELHELCFSYASDKPPAIRNLTLRVPAGVMVGIVGANGSGKSTLVDLLVGLLPPHAGWIEVDGERLDAASVASWRETIAYLPQQVFLFDASVSENIALGDDHDLDPARVREAAILAGADEFVSALPSGFAQRLGERGVQLSGGQRQLIGLARALYRRPSVLVLDEATAALDHDADLALGSVLAALRGRCTIFVIAHRSEILDRCDMIVTLAHGQIVARPDLTLQRAGGTP